MTTVLSILLFGAALWLSYANGANDNLKGVATLLGSGTTSYRGALAWGTLTTFAGSVCAILISGGLISAFSGKGVVAAELVGDPNFLASVGLASAILVMAATLIGMPISTTHALVGGLTGAGVAVAGFAGVGWGNLARTFALPLLLSPLIAGVIVAGAYPLLRRARLALGLEHNSCVCVVTDAGLVPVRATAATPRGAHEPFRASTDARSELNVLVAPREVCVTRYTGSVLGFQASGLLDKLHFASAGAVSFSRGLNDTPKIAALLLAGAFMPSWQAMLAIGSGMAVGAVLNARRVGQTMSFDITPMNAGQGFTANLTTAVLVLGASKLGLPVSTTHVSVGSLVGLGVTTQAAHAATIWKIGVAWAATLPAGFALGWILHHVLAQ